jgi:hypothetical protein
MRSRGVQPNRRDGSKRKSGLEARYVNYFEVGHNACEFIFDFGQYHPETRRAHINSRMVTGPVCAKLLADLLRSALQRFEEEHGVIQAAEDDMDPLELVKQSIAGYDRRLSTVKGTRKADDPNR